MAFLTDPPYPAERKVRQFIYQFKDYEDSG